MSKQSDREEQAIIETVIDMASLVIVGMVEQMLCSSEWDQMTKAAGVQHRQEVHDRAIDEAIDKLTNLRQGGVL